jgi:hypothetical protein
MNYASSIVELWTRQLIIFVGVDRALQEVPEETEGWRYMSQDMNGHKPRIFTINFAERL